jgi:DNA-binding beta-propeller fold protein YncE
LCLLAACPLLGPVTAHADEGAPQYHVIKTIPLEGDTGWDYLTVDPAGRRLYVTRGTHVAVVDIETGKPAGEIPNTPGVHGVAVAPKHGRGFTSNGGDSTVTIFDLKTLKEIERVKVGNRPDAIIYDDASDRVFTFNAGTKDATAIDAGTGKVAGKVILGGKPEFAAADGKGQVYVNLEDKSTVVVFDSKGLRLKHQWPLAPGKEPTGMAIDRKDRVLFVTCGNQKMIVLNADNGEVIDTAPIGPGTDACAYDPGTGFAFSSNGRDGTLTIVHKNANGHYRVVANVPTQAGARTMALDPKTHNIYLAAAKMAGGGGAAPGVSARRPGGGPIRPRAPAGGEGGGPPRRRFEPGSFVILVVGPGDSR